MDSINPRLSSSPFWKFRAIDTNTIKLLINQELWFSHPRYFNDPFDTNVDVKKLVKQLEGKLKNPALFYKAIDNFLPTYEKDLRSRFVFSTNIGAPDHEPFKEVLMWSHYACNHTGICIGFSMDSVKTWLFDRSSASRRRANYGIFEGSGFLDHTTDAKIEYAISKSLDVSESLEITILYVDACIGGSSLNRIEKVFETIFIKAHNWTYEMEHRFILFDNENEDKPGVAVPFAPTDIENIIFGLKMSDTHKTVIRNIRNDKGWRHVKLWETFPGQGLFDLDFKEVIE